MFDFFEQIDRFILKPIEIFKEAIERQNLKLTYFE